MREIGSFEAKTHLSQILEKVVLGESFAITKHGKVIAFLTPAETSLELNIQEAVVGIRKLRKKIARRGVKMSLKELYEMRKTGEKY